MEKDYCKEESESDRKQYVCIKKKLAAASVFYNSYTKFRSHSNHDLSFLHFIPWTKITE